MRGLVAGVIALAAAACANDPAPAPQGPAPHPIDVAAARTTPAPQIEWTNGAFVSHGLPAIAAAGEVIELGVASADGKQLTLEVRGADDHVLHATQVTASSLDAANHELAIDHGVHDLRAMHALDVEAGHDGEDQHWATGDNLDVEWREHHLRVFRHNVTQPLADRDSNAWLAPAATAATCVGANPAFLRAVYHAPGMQLGGGNTVVVAMAYRGTAECPAPPDQLHVVSWVGAR